MRNSRIATLVPQQGAMCLLDEILSFDERSIVCRTASHRSPDNPLRCDGRLSAITGIEYGAQAMAVHGALQSAGVAQGGMLAGTRAVRCHARYLDDENGPLTVRAERLVVDGRRLLYAFVVEGAKSELVSGRIAVVLTAGTIG
ncbi:MAG: 3-hydroxylacyl-ACP dehydratase [Betaproteobacteria bacterium]|nr:3-hydroxylacyl-ACP dehydratase [Betaproteobacteria bacterium]